MRFIDLDGNNWWDVTKGVANIVGGGFNIAIGAGMCCAPTGVTQVAGAGLIVLGHVEIGLGTAQIVSNGKKDIPSGPAGVIGMVASGMTNDGGKARQVGDVVDVSASWLLPGPKITSTAGILNTTANAVGTAGTALDVAQSSSNPKKSDENTNKNSNNNSSNNQPTTDNTDQSQTSSTSKSNPDTQSNKNSSDGSVILQSNVNKAKANVNNPYGW